MPDRPRGPVTLVTHAALAHGAPDDHLLADALAQEGVAVRFAAWNDADVDWAASPLAVVRSAWDYHHAPLAWRRWLASTAGLTRLLNPPQLLGWNTDKRYLQALQAASVPCVPTQFVEPGAKTATLPPSWRDLVVKPAVAASAFGVRRFQAAEDMQAALIQVRQLAAHGAVLVQPYLPAVETARERSLVFIDGRFSHAFSKPAFSANATGGTAVLRHEPDAAELALATQALAAAPQASLYARVDLVPGDAGPLLMELELIEPDLALRLHPAAATELATACVRALASG